MAYIITKDIITEGSQVDHWLSVKGMTIEQCRKMCKHKFRLLDDDFEVYFEGMSSDNSSFLALDTFGGSYGCTMIEYWENGAWEML